MFDDLGSFIKSNFEDRTRILLPRRTYCIVRVDGKSFSKYTSRFAKPFDYDFIEDMNTTAKHLCRNMMGAVCGYVFSDEISILLTDFAQDQTQAYFDGNIQKIASVSASLATGEFNRQRIKRDPSAIDNMACFDGRVFSIPDYSYVIRYFQWRQMDCTRNSITSAARAIFSHNQLNGKNTKEMQAMLLERDINWNDYPVGAKRGRFVIKVNQERLVEYEVKGEKRAELVIRSGWEVGEPDIWTRNTSQLVDAIPSIPAFQSLSPEG